MVEAAWEAGISTNELCYVLVHNEVFDLEEHIADPRQGRRPTIGMPHLAQIFNAQVQWLMDSGEDRLRLSERGERLLAIIQESERSKKFQRTTRLWKPPPRPPDYVAGVKPIWLADIGQKSAFSADSAELGLALFACSTAKTMPWSHWVNFWLRPVDGRFQFGGIG